MKNKYVVILGFVLVILSFISSYNFNRLVLKTYFATVEKNYYQIENFYKFKSKNIFFDYADQEHFVAYTKGNDFEFVKEEFNTFLSSVNKDILIMCNASRPEESIYGDGCEKYLMIPGKQTLIKKKAFFYNKLILLLIFNLFVIIFIYYFPKKPKIK